jgi:uncharacterized membrane protein YdbT with pleckstrin-like domain
MARYTLQEGEHEIAKVRPSTIKLFLMLIVTLGLYLPWFLVRIVQNRFTRWVLTNRRVIAMSGVLNQTTSTLGLERIQDVVYNRTFWDRIIGTGSLVIETAAEGKPVSITFIREDAEFRDALLKAIDTGRHATEEPHMPGGL